MRGRKRHRKKAAKKDRREWLRRFGTADVPGDRYAAWLQSGWSRWERAPRGCGDVAGEIGWFYGTRIIEDHHDVMAGVVRTTIRKVWT